MRQEFERTWDYLILTVAREQQADVIRRQLELRLELQLLLRVEHVLVLADPGGISIGSGGSTLCALLAVLRDGRARGLWSESTEDWRTWISSLRILMIHSGGEKPVSPIHDSLGKLLLPVPGEGDQILPLALLDRILPNYLHLPVMPSGGQLVVASGDVLLSYDPCSIQFPFRGLSGLSFWADPGDTCQHGAFRTSADGIVLRYYQKPSREKQLQEGLLNRYGQSLLDIGVMRFTMDAVLQILDLFETAPDSANDFSFSPFWQGVLEGSGFDLYRELGCALGKEVSERDYVTEVQENGSRWDPRVLKKFYTGLQQLPFHVQVIPRCDFYHFGSSQEILYSAMQLYRRDHGLTRQEPCLLTSNELGSRGDIHGRRSWVDQCRVEAELFLEGNSFISQLDIKEPLRVPAGICMTALPVQSQAGEASWLLMIFGTEDDFHLPSEGKATYCNTPFSSWLDEMHLQPEELWALQPSGEQGIMADAPLFPLVSGPGDVHRWLWIANPDSASKEQKARWMQAERLSLRQVRSRLRLGEVAERQKSIVSCSLRNSIRKAFHPQSGLSARELSWILRHSDQNPAVWTAEVLREGDWHYRVEPPGASLDSFTLPRILHTLGTAIHNLTASGSAGSENVALSASFLTDWNRKEFPLREYLLEQGIRLNEDSLQDLGEKLKSASFDYMGKCILSSGTALSGIPRSCLRDDEIVWGRSPARLDLGGGWTDTPPYALERGGCVINAAVNLNGQPPIQCYGRVIPERLIRITSIDQGTREEITSWENLLDYRQATSVFGLAKAALVLNGFSPFHFQEKSAASFLDLLRHFGGGIELTTLAAIPKGSGLGTSSIMGAVVLSVVHRIMGKKLEPNDLFHGVLRLEQALTTGGGWQDQIGGAVRGVKVLTAQPGMVPDIHIRFVLEDVLDPQQNDGCTLLYYTGITRLAKNILQQVVGRYLDRDRKAMRTLKLLHDLPARISDAMSRKNLPDFGACIDEAWKLNKELDPDSSNASVETLLSRIRPFIHGAKLLGAGGGGFLLIVCKSKADAQAVRQALSDHPPNPLARFFDFGISGEGLVVTVS